MEIIKIALDKEKSKQYIKRDRYEFEHDPTRIKYKKSKKNLFAYFKLFSMEELTIMFRNPTYEVKFLRIYLSHKIGETQPFWKQIANVVQNMDQHKNYFKKLVKLPYTKYFTETINKDVSRTLNKDIKFQKRLSKILEAYAKRNPQIGYCQGFNYIAAFYLNHNYTKEETFWFLCHLFENVLPLNYYNNLLGVLVDDRIIKILLKHFMPDLWNHFTDLQIDTTLFTIQWLVCCFTLTVQFQTLIMELLLTRGSQYLIIVALTYFYLIKDKVMDMFDLSQILLYVEDFTTHFSDKEEFMKCLDKFYLNLRVLNYARDEMFHWMMKDLKKYTQAEIEKQYQNRQDYLQRMNCDKNYPFCINQLELSRLNKTNSDFVIIQHSQFTVVEDYIQDKSFRPSIIKQKSTDDILIGRSSEHICQPILQEEKIKQQSKSEIQFDKKMNNQQIPSVIRPMDVNIKQGYQQTTKEIPKQDIKEKLDQESTVEISRIIDDSMVSGDKSVTQKNAQKSRQKSPIKEFLLMPFSYWDTREKLISKQATKYEILKDTSQTEPPHSSKNSDIDCRSQRSSPSRKSDNLSKYSPRSNLKRFNYSKFYNDHNLNIEANVGRQSQYIQFYNEIQKKYDI